MAKSIKLGADTYLDASGVVVDASGTTLAQYKTVQTSSFTNNGISFTMAKKNGICTLSALSGSLTYNFNANTAFASIPSGWRPAIGLEVTETSSGSKRISIGTSGAIQFSSAQTSGTYVRFSVTYVLA